VTPGKTLFDFVRGSGSFPIIGLETLEMARIHEGAIAILVPSSSTDEVITRAEIFLPRP
jgi:hypothetical protein